MSLRQQLRILVVDDTATSRALLTKCLEDLGFQDITWERNARDGMLAMLNRPCHLIISDHNMPGESGLDFLWRIRNHQHLSQTAFLLVTGNPTREIVQRGIELGMNNYMEKPVTAAGMKACIEKVFGEIT